MHKIAESTNTGVTNNTAYLWSKSTTTICLKITLGRINMIKHYKHCIKMCNYDVSMRNSPTLKSYRNDTHM